MAGARVVPGPVAVERLTGRIALLLEETAHQGLLALRLLIEARDLLQLGGEGQDRRTAELMADLERRLTRVERDGRERLRQARRLLQRARVGHGG